MDDIYNRFFPYLMEVRKRLFFIASIFLISSALGFIYYEKIITTSLGIFNLEGINIVFTSPFQFLELSINSGLLVGLIAVFPLIIVQVLSFLKPALKKSEFKLVISLLPLSIFLFIFGFTYGIFIMRYVLVIFYEKSLALSIGNFLDVSKFLSQILLTSALMGLAFQFPVILTVLMRLRVITYSALSKQRMIAYSSSIIFAAFLPPTDLLSLALLTVPLVILFETTLLLNKVVFKAPLKPKKEVKRNV
ncbi:twin-arginine translocase subunit TatC [Patescibacteria group bacterium]|nr:twin-arginine translocase subunit TatC [Patescibacteria group bacterium]MBU0777315.1 twin-arginine translocase subunit TatC [Patescibacteria group bacterium]MBU0846105.1 twin-arginine translocase subunit TatC [Patescibacteria group bacterium]MBU0923158.1 twin-arginine translocase subunit TatC [Patescibacteria group bacterium]MBU1066873.1 twin-arginine translocase subunit TatC [Patescibacteria group bacterium]